MQLHPQFTTIVCSSFGIKNKQASDAKQVSLANGLLVLVFSHVTLKSVTDAELCDKCTVLVNILLVDVSKKVSSVTYHLEKTSA